MVFPKYDRFYCRAVWRTCLPCCLELPHIYDRILNAAPSSGRDANRQSKMKFTEQSGRKSDSKENKTSVCAELTLSVLLSYQTDESLWISDSNPLVLVAALSLFFVCFRAI